MIECDWLVGEIYEIRKDGVLIATATGRTMARSIVEFLEGRVNIEPFAEALREDYRRRGMIPDDNSTWQTVPEPVREHYRESARFIASYMGDRFP